MTSKQTILYNYNSFLSTFADLLLYKFFNIFPLIIIIDVDKKYNKIFIIDIRVSPKIGHNISFIPLCKVNQ